MLHGSCETQPTLERLVPPACFVTVVMAFPYAAEAAAGVMSASSNGASQSIRCPTHATIHSFADSSIRYFSGGPAGEDLSFYRKAKNCFDGGGVAVIIFNNEEGMFVF